MRFFKNLEYKKFIFIDGIDGVKGKKIFEYLNNDKNYDLIFKSKTRYSCAFKLIQ